MEYLLDRSEFLAVAALMRASDIIGIDASQLLPASLDQRHAMYAAGEKSLIDRGLARQTAVNQIQFEQTLLGVARAVTQPQNAVVVVRALPGRGQQLFLYYERDGAWVEQTLPDSRTHRLAEIGATDALLSRLLQVFDFPESGGDGMSFNMYIAGFVALARVAREGGAVDAANAVASDKAGLDSLVRAYVSGPASGTIAMLPVREGRETNSVEIALARGQTESWIIVSESNDAGRVSAFRSDRALLADTLGTMLRALEKVGA